MDDNESKEMFDLGSTPVDDDFDPFATDDEQDADASEQQTQTQTETTTPAPLKADTPVKPSEVKTQDLSEKPPVFEYAGATENIDDTSKTFDELRIEKSADFPELEDGKRVSWTVEYGKITKTVADPKSTSIGKMKSDIETSKEFIESLKKAKDKNPVCKVKPRVTAQSKGTVSEYKGVYKNISEAETAGKVISIVPAKDGIVYEIRDTEMGRFTTPISGCDMLSDIRAGFNSALPRIPMNMMVQIVSLFRHYMNDGNDREVLVNIYWDKRNREFLIDVPAQTVTKASVDSRIDENYSDARYIHYMDIHSHNSMRAFFSAIDDADEKATRLYTVIGRLDKYFPDIKTRLSNGGKFWPINTAEVFELVSQQFPSKWKDNVHFRASHFGNKNR